MSFGGMQDKTPKTTGTTFRSSLSGPPAIHATGQEGGFFEEIDHTADVALRCGGSDLETFFRSAAQGLYHLMGLIAESPGESEPHFLSLEAEDTEGLLVEWLGELVYLAESRGLVFEAMAFDVLSPARLEARLTGRRAGRADRSIKAVTYHGLKVEKTPEGYAATVVFDI